MTDRHIAPELVGMPYMDKHAIQKYAANLASGGIWAEFGVWLGCSARKLLSWMPDNTQLHLFDSFKGLPEDWVFNRQLNPKGHFAVDKIPLFNDTRVCIHVGWFEDTLPNTGFGALDFIHIDSDIYSAAKTVFENIEVRRGTIILFDEYHGYADYKNHERKAYREWSDRTGNEIEWLGFGPTQAVGRVK